ncbi:ParB/RepB/Spo0J family partition protein [bacterium]|nr:ParB/RepB/Spo0J family partition protein [bacterium]
MANTRRTLTSIEGNLEESMGVRAVDLRPKLSPVPQGKDAGRRPLRNFGQVDINQVIPDPEQPRVEFTEDALERLAQSIRDKGQLSPIRVRWSDDVKKWVIIAGERRWRATKQAGLPTIECYFHDGDLPKSEVLEQQLIENLLREDLKPMEEAKAFSTLMQMNSWTGKQLAEALRLDPSKVSRSLALLKLPEDIQAKIEAGELAARSASEIARLNDDDARRELAQKAAEGKLTRDQAVKAVRQRKGKPANRSKGTSRTFVSEAGWKITVSSTHKGTYHDIRIALQEALDEVEHLINNNVQLL